jgi:biotin carboxyl carrier protein
MDYRAIIGVRQIRVVTREDGHERLVTLDGRELRVDWQPIGGTSPNGQSAAAAHYSALIGEHSYEAYVRRVADEGADGETFEVMIAGQPYRVTVQDERTQALASLAGGGHSSGDATIRAPMPGLVSNVMAEEGVHVDRGQAIVMLEAMKMENDLTTPRAGIVKHLRVARGQTVNQGEVLAVVGDAPGTEAAEAAAEDDNHG